MFEQFLIIVNLLAQDVRLPLGLNEPLIHATEKFAAKPALPVILASLETGSVGQAASLPLADDELEEENEVAIAAERMILMDATSAKVLLEKNSDEPAAMASIAKLMTALVVLDEAEDLDQVLTVPSEVAKLDPEGTAAGLIVGDKLTVYVLLQALLVGSANDAAVTLANGLAGSEKAFVKKMNQRAKELGLADTTFANSSGLDAKENISTARDLAFLLLEAQKQPLVREFSTLRRATIESEKGTTYVVAATDKLLEDADVRVVAAKTGHTDLAGSSIVVEALENGHHLIAVLLDSPDRFGEAEKLLNYGFSTFVWPTGTGTNFADDAQVNFGG